MIPVNYNTTFNLQNIYSLFFFIFCLSLLCRDIFEPLGLPVFIYLSLLFLIPLSLMIVEFVNNRKITFNSFLLFLVTLFYILISAYNVSGIKFFIPMIYAGIAFRKMDLKLIVKYLFVIQILCLVIRYWMISKGVIFESEADAFWKTEDGRFAHDLGYGNANTAGMNFFFLLCMFHILMYNKSKLLSFIFILLGAVSFYNYTVSRTSLVSTLLLLLTYVVPAKFEYIFRNKYLLLLVPVVVLSPLIFLNYFFNISGLDDFFSGRLYYISYLLILFDNPMSFITGIDIGEGNTFAIDNVFCYLLVKGGILAIIVFFWFYRSFILRINYIPFYIIAVVMVIVVSGLGEASWAAFGRLGASFFWIIFLNRSYIKKENRIYYCA